MFRNSKAGEYFREKFEGNYLIGINGANASPYGISGLALSSELDHFQAGTTDNLLNANFLWHGERITDVIFTWSDILNTVEFKTNDKRSFKFGSVDGENEERV